MNEKIKELFAEATFEEERIVDGMYHPYIPLQIAGEEFRHSITQKQYHKFAELIVKECIEVCRSRVGKADYNTGRMHCASDIKEHFGIDNEN